MKKFFPVLLMLTALAVAGSCTGNGAGNATSGKAEGLVESAYNAHKSDRILNLADSLEALGEMSAIQADYWRGYAYSRLRNRRLAEASWSEAVLLEPKNDSDAEYYVRSANRLSDMMLLKNDYESALRVALPALEKLHEGGKEEGEDYAHLLIAVGCCDLNLGNVPDARDKFEQAYSEFLKMPGRYNTIMSGIITITDHCLAEKQYPDALVWVARLEQALDNFRALPKVNPEVVDKQEARVCLYKACVMEGMGYRTEAANAYDSALKCNYAKTAEGRMEALNYLMLAGRWSEAADNYQLLDKQLTEFGMSLTMDNISRFLLPKFEANYRSHRDAVALETGMQIRNSLDSALVWLREDKAAELAAIYHTQEIKQDLMAQEAKIQRDRFLAVLIGMLVLIAGLLMFLYARHGASVRLKEAYNQLEKANARAQEASRVKTAFLQQISHEVRTPINVLSGFAQILTTPGMELDEESRAQINTGVLDNTKRITGLISKILDLSDLVSTTTIEKKDIVSMRDIVSEAAANCNILDNEDIEYEVVSAGGEAKMLTNKHAASHVLALLLENAVKYTGKGTVRVCLEPGEKNVKFVVEDTGIGVPAEDAERIFGQFVQLDDYREGTGVGLSVARSIARRLGGDVTLDTSYTSGARFVFTLPYLNFLSSSSIPK